MIKYICLTLSILLSLEMKGAWGGKTYQQSGKKW